ncbi:hypothetical protein GCM10010376_54510 [Streptomyces violaceusniger]
MTAAAFRIDVHAVTNERFARFVRETGHVTEAERFGWSYVFAGFLPAAPRRGAPRPEGTPWLLPVPSVVLQPLPRGRPHLRSPPTAPPATSASAASATPEPSFIPGC